MIFRDISILCNLYFHGVNVGETISWTFPQTSILIGSMVAIPSHRSFMTMFTPATLWLTSHMYGDSPFCGLYRFMLLHRCFTHTPTFSPWHYTQDARSKVRKASRKASSSCARVWAPAAWPEGRTGKEKHLGTVKTQWQLYMVTHRFLMVKHGDTNSNSTFGFK